MLTELSQIRQIQKEPRRRWFADDYFDLIVWFAKRGEIIGFQLCYDIYGEERALTWRKKTGFSHQRVDDGELKRPYKATPILVADGSFDYAAISQLFRERSGNMDEKVAKFVLEQIGRYHQEPQRTRKP
jgi:hypothetical protein